MIRCAAYLLYVLACVVPGWYLRDMVAAELQLRQFEPDLSPPTRTSRFRKLGQGGQEHLWKVMREDRQEYRRERALWILLDYSSPTVTQWMIAGLVSSDRELRNSASLWACADSNERSISTCIGEMAEEDLEQMLRSGGFGYTPFMFISDLWLVRPDAAGRVGTRWIQETGDVYAVTFFRDGLPGRLRSEASNDAFRQFARALLSAGMENPREEVRAACSKTLDEMEHGRGRR